MCNCGGSKKRERPTPRTSLGSPTDGFQRSDLGTPTPAAPAEPQPEPATAGGDLL